MDRAIVETYVAGAGKVGEAIRGLTRGDFAKDGGLGGWTIGQIVLHLMDSDLIASDRMKRVIAETNPAIIGYSEGAFAEKLSYDKQDPFVAAEIFRMNRELAAVVLRNLPAVAFARFGTHNQRGKVTLGEMVVGYSEHLEHHLGFLRRKRAAIGRGT